MTASLSWRRAGFVGVRVTGEIGHFLDLATEQTVPLGALDPELVEMLLTAADTACFFTRAELLSGAAGLEIRTWHVRLCHDGRSRLLAVPEPFSDPAIRRLVWLARDCLDARRVIGIEDVSQALYDAVAASRAPPESAAFNHEIDPDVEQRS